MDDMKEIMEDFLVEAFELVEQIDHDLIELESNPEDLDLLNRIFRVAHTVKGSSSFLNFDILTKLTHHMEDVLNKARRGELKITPDIMDVVLESVDMMKGLLHGIRDNGNDTDVGIEIEDICKRLTAISEGEAPDAAASEPAPAAPGPVAEAPKEPEPEPISDENLSNLSDEEVEAEIERLLKVRKAEDQARRAQKAAGGEAPKPAAPAAPQTPAPSNSAPAPKPAPAKPADKKEEKKVPATGGGASADEQTIRVEVKRLDHLMNLIGELVLGKNRLLKIYDDVEERYEGEKFLEELNQVVSSLSLVTTDIQLAVMKTRMLPIAKVFNKFPRMIRDLSRELNKQIDLEITGEETELDRTVIDEIGDPMVHLIRNSLDHGIERREDRSAIGKPEKGILKISAYQEGSGVIIEVSDDGAGIDPERVKQKAVERGILTEEEASVMTDEEAVQLVLIPGFSMAKAVTDISGRGVGMDAVRTKVEALGGQLDLVSKLGQGTRVYVRLPLTLAIVLSLLIKVGNETYAISLENVEETILVKKENIKTVHGAPATLLRGEVLSLSDLGNVLETEMDDTDRDEYPVVVVKIGKSKIGFIVNELIGQQEIVIKSLGRFLSKIKGITGGTILGDGNVALILDVASFYSTKG